MDITNTLQALQSPTSQCNAGDMLPLCQNCISVRFAPTILSHSVTFTTFPYQNAAITEFRQPQKPLHRSAGLYGEGTCEDCILKKKFSLNRQVVELLKKHNPIEVDGKEILGWYILLTAKERKIIKESGGLEEFLRDNPSLQIINNRVTLMSKSNLKTFDNSSEFNWPIMENQESIGHKFSPIYSEVYSDEALHPPGHAYGQSVNELVTEVIPHQETLCPDPVNKEELLCGNKLSACEYKTQVTPSWEIWDSDNDWQLMSEDPSHSEVYSYVPMKTPPNFTETLSALHDSGITEGDVFIESTNSVFKGSGRVTGPAKSHGTIQFPKYRSDHSDHPGDQDTSSSDFLDDETFLSVKSGSFHSRSSSQFSLDGEDTDVEQCAFEEALEDLSSFSICRHVNHSPGLLRTFTDTSPPSVEMNPPIEAKKAFQATNNKMNLTDLRTVSGNPKLKDMTSKTGLSWVSECYDKETQTIKTGTQDIGVNTDIMINGLFSLAQDTIQARTGACKNMELCNGAGDGLLSAYEARAVKAELQLLDMQRVMCLQLCWKTHQQSTETQSFLSLQRAPTVQSATEVSFNLISALAEVEEKYQVMKKQIQSGVPLDTLEPLNVQLTKVKSPADNLLKECFMDAQQHSKMQKWSDGASLDFKKTKSVENVLSSTPISAVRNDQQRGEEGASNSANQSELQQRYYVHVGNIALSVKEVDLMNVFQKYKVLNVFLEESSMMSRYAVLIFTCSEQAQAAVKEMDGKEFWGKKLKVRAVKNSNSNLSLAFKTSGEVQIGTTEPKECSPLQPSTCDKTTKPGPHGDPPKAQGGESMKDFFMDKPNKYGFFSYNNVNKVQPAASYSNSPFVLPAGNQWMLHSLYSNMAYNGIPNPMAVPYMYPLSASPSCAPCRLHVPVTNPNIFTPDVNMKSNVPAFIGKVGSSYVPVKPVKPIYATNSQIGGGAPLSNVRDAVQKNTRSSTARTTIKGRETNAGNALYKPTAAQSLIGPAPIFTSNNGKLPAALPTTLCKEGTAVCDSASSRDNVTKHTSVPSVFTSTAPLRVPTFVPCNVTIPEPSQTSSSTTSSAGVLSYSTAEAPASSSAASRQGGSPSYTEMDWGMSELEEEAAEFDITIVPNQFNFYQFLRVMAYLTERHKDVPREQIVATLDEIRRSRGGTLSGVAIPEIISEAISKLAAGKMPPA